MHRSSIRSKSQGRTLATSHWQGSPERFPYGTPVTANGCGLIPNIGPHGKVPAQRSCKVNGPCHTAQKRSSGA